MRGACKLLRDAFFGHNRETVYAAVPDLPEGAFGAARIALLVPLAVRFRIVPEGDLIPPLNATGIHLRISNGDTPREGAWMDHIEPLPGPLSLGDHSYKEHIVADCMIVGNRYGSCWFVGWISDR